MNLARRIALTGLLLLAGVPSAQAARGFTLGFSGEQNLTDGSAAAQNVWIPDAVREGARIVRVGVGWRAVAPAVRPPGFIAGDPASPGYNWTPVDRAVRQLTAAGLQPLIEIGSAPTWAEGRHRPSNAAPGSWRPSPSAFGAFAAAAAKRYSGRFPDPLAPGSSLPRVRYWQGWNEPNLSLYLTPQWIRAGRHWKAESPVLFRKLMNSFYKSVKKVAKSNFVVTAGTAPYGDPPGGQRIPPVQFDRVLFCLTKRLAPTHCPHPVHLDAVSHHPYGVGGPQWHALNPDDAAVPDVYKIAKVLRAAQRWRHLLPRGHKRLWVTEIGWDSSPPDPRGVPIARQARWYEQAMYVLWRQRVDTMLWLQIADDPPVPTYESSYQGGLFYLDGTAKPAATAYRFPFVTRRMSRSRVQLWGRSPQRGELTVEASQGGRWRRLWHTRTGLHQVFARVVSLRGKAVLRARVGGQTSLSWKQR